MDANSRRVHSVASFDELPKMLPELKLHHGQTLWLLTELGFRGVATQRTFYEYIKSLRKLGVPFDADGICHAQRGPAKNYSYYHLMELALALTLRVYHVVPNSVLIEIISHRKRLYGHYRRAYAERSTGRGEPVEFEIDGRPPLRMRGIFLDLQLNFSGGQLVKFGPPKSISPYQAVSIFPVVERVHQEPSEVRSETALHATLHHVDAPEEQSNRAGEIEKAQSRIHGQSFVLGRRPVLTTRGPCFVQIRAELSSGDARSGLRR